MHKEVVIVHRRMTHYRVPLFELMRVALAERSIRLRVLHGEATVSERSKRDEGHLDWAETLSTRYFLNGRLMWQPFMQRCGSANLIVVPQENKHLHNIPAILNPTRRQRLAFWGHGRNMQGPDSETMKERFKRWLMRRVDWWFTYTDMSRQFVLDGGFPDSRITVLNNSVDTNTLRQAVERAGQHGKAALKSDLGLGGGPLACFIGSLYADKRLDFMVQAADRMHSHLPGFQLAIAGAGPDAELVQQAVAVRPYLHFLGPVHGERKAQLLAASDALLNPGLVGLGILDAFVAGIPILTTDCGIHSPEIAYLQSGHNGLMTDNNLQVYADACVALLSDPVRMSALRQGALDSSHTFSIQAMAQRFCAGIEAALQAPRLRESPPQ